MENGINEKADLKDLIKQSPGLKTMPPGEFENLLQSVDKMPEERKIKIKNAIMEESQQLAEIENKYQAERARLYAEYQEYLKQEKTKEANELRAKMETEEREKERLVMSGLLEKLKEV